jgi:Cytochrome bd-type quinol oxidase, subunit 2
VCLIVRVVSFEWRTKTKDPRWRTVWTWANAIGSFGASFVWGVGLSALLYGVPIDNYGNYTGNFWSLFSVYTVLAGSRSCSCLYSTARRI